MARTHQTIDHRSNTMNGSKVPWADIRTGPVSPEEKNRRLFTKTVTNFAQVKYDNNGGLNP